MEACFKASRGKLITHTSTINNKGPRGGGYCLKLCLNIKGQMHELSSYVLVGNKPSTLQKPGHCSWCISRLASRFVKPQNIQQWSIKGVATSILKLNRPAPNFTCASTKPDTLPLAKRRLEYAPWPSKNTPTQWRFEEQART